MNLEKKKKVVTEYLRRHYHFERVVPGDHAVIDEGYYLQAKGDRLKIISIRGLINNPNHGNIKDFKKSLSEIIESEG
jgi:hypothetical protein